MLETLKRKLVRTPFWEWVRSFLKHLRISVICLAALMIGDETEVLQRAERKKAFHNTTEFLAKNMFNVPSFRDRFSLLKYSLSLANGNIGLFCQFGVFKAISLNFMASIKPEIIFYGFDSFEGLPDDYRHGYEKGKFRLQKLPEVEKNVCLIRGWFNEAIPGFLKAHTEYAEFLHIDCDLYSSSKTILENFLPRFRPGTVIVFDEYFNYPNWQDNGEHKAWMEFAEQESILFDYIGFVKHRYQLAVRIKQIGIQDNQINQLTYA